MKTLNNLILATTLLGGLVLSGCGTSNTQTSQVTPTPSEKPQTEAKGQQATESNGKLTIADGSKKMKQITDEIQAGLKDNKEDIVIKKVEELDGVWEKFEDAVKDNKKELYDRAEGPIGIIKAGVKVKPLDAKTINNETEKLRKVFEEIAKLK